MEWLYKGVKIRVVKGDITELDVEAIVNPANSRMIMGGGVAGVIKRKGGEEIEREAMGYAPVPVGKAVVTSGGRLKAKWVIHAPTMERPAMRTTLEKVRAAVTGALEAAVNRGIRRLAFPGMGTGVGGLRVYDAVKAMLESIKEAIDRGWLYEEIVLVAYGDENFREFKKALSDFTSQ